MSIPELTDSIVGSPLAEKDPDTPPLFKLKPFKELSKHPANSNVMKIKFPHKGLLNKLKLHTKTDEITESALHIATETVSETTNEQTTKAPLNLERHFSNANDNSLTNQSDSNTSEVPISVPAEQTTVTILDETETSATRTTSEKPVNFMERQSQSATETVVDEIIASQPTEAPIPHITKVRNALLPTDHPISETTQESLATTEPILQDIEGIPSIKGESSPPTPSSTYNNEFVTVTEHSISTTAPSTVDSNSSSESPTIDTLLELTKLAPISQLSAPTTDDLPLLQQIMLGISARRHRVNPMNMLMNHPLLNFHSSPLQRKKNTKRAADNENYITPSPRRVPPTRRPTLFERLETETSEERANRIALGIERLMHVVTIAGHVDSFLANRLRKGVRTLNKLFDTEEDTRTRLT